MGLEKQFFNAAKKGNISTIEKLLNNSSIDINIQDELEYTALTHAAERNHPELIAFLLKHPDIDTEKMVLESEDAIGGNALHIAAFRGYDDIVSMLVKHSPQLLDEYEYCGYTPLHETVLNYKYSTFKLLLDLCADPEVKTGEDKALIDIPKGLNTVGLIMYKLLDEPPSQIEYITLIKMLAFLASRSKLDMPKSKHFMNDKDSKRLYALVERNLGKPALLLKKLYSFFEIKEADFRQLPDYDIRGDLNYLSDSDSEADADYLHINKLEVSREVVQTAIEETFADNDGGSLIPHFRGEHFYPKYFKKEDMHTVRKLSDAQATGIIPRQSIYSAATHELASVEFTLPVVDDFKDESEKEKVREELSSRQQKLQIASSKVISAIEKLQAEKNVESCLHGASRGSRTSYKSRYDEFIQRYVNSYTQLKKDMEEAAKKDLSVLKANRTNMKYKILKELGFTRLPLVSTSEDPHWAFEYAVSLINYNKSDTHKPYSKSETPPLMPCYQPNGQPRFPYLGVVYATLHQPTKLQSEMTSRILDLFGDNQIDTRCGAPGGHVTGGYIRAKERIFVNCIDANHIFVGMIVRIPNFIHSYRKFIADKYGMTEEEYVKFKLQLRKYSSRTAANKLVNEKQYFRTQQNIIQFVIDKQKKQLLDFLDSCAKQQGYTLQMMGSQPGELLPPKIQDKDEEKALIDKFVKKRKLNSESQSNPSMLFTPKRARTSDDDEEKKTSLEDDATVLSKKLIALNASGNDQNLGQHAHRMYWYSVGDGFRLLIAVRKKSLNYIKLDGGSYVFKASGEEYSHYRENRAGIFIADPYIPENFEASFLEDIKTITGGHPVEVSYRNNTWEQMPKLLIIAVLTGNHWRAIRVQINYLTRNVSILWDDPYGKNQFDPTLREKIFLILKSGIDLLFDKHVPSIPPHNIDYVKCEKPIDQQGRGRNGWDCGTIIFANIHDYIHLNIKNSELSSANARFHYRIKLATDDNHDSLIQAIREEHCTNFREISGFSLSMQERLNTTSKMIGQQYDQFKSTINAESLHEVSLWEPEKISCLFSHLETLRLNRDASERHAPYKEQEFILAFEFVRFQVDENLRLGLNIA